MKRLYPKQPLVGVGAVIMRNGEIVLERRKNDPDKEKWSIPGGLAELGESLEQAMIREVREETNLEVEKPKLVDVVENINLEANGRVRYHFVMVDFLVRPRGGSLKAADDAAELRWVSLKDVEKYDLSKGFRKFFKENKQKIKNYARKNH